MIFIGGYSDEGIVLCDFDEGSLSLTLRQKVSGTVNPSYLLKCDNKLYACFETGKYDGEGAVAEYDMLPDGSVGMLKSVSRSGGNGPCHLSADGARRWLFAANYNSGTAAIYGLDESGAVTGMTDRIVHTGSGPDRKRQDHAHAHFIRLSPDNKRIYIADLGLDAVAVYPFDNVNGKVNPDRRKLIQSPVPGAGPRHMLLGKNGIIYFVCEMGNIVCVYDENKNESLQCISTLPNDCDTFSTAAAIRFSPCGMYVVVSNRGYDSLASYRIGDDGRLTLVCIEPVNGKTPRDFNFICGGKYILTANQDSNDLSLLSFASDGTIRYVKKIFETRMPTFVEEY